MAAALEVSWFAALCDDDAEQLGVPDASLISSVRHCSAIVEEAEAQGFDSVLLPSGYELGIDASAFAAAVATRTSRIRLLLAIRTGELWPAQLARQLATIDEVAAGRLDVNVISSPMPGEDLGSAERYDRSLEVMEILDSLLRGRSAPSTELWPAEVAAPRIARDRRRRPPFYFGGLSEPAREVAARAADVYLMWPETRSSAAALVADLRSRAARHDRELRFGYRVHLVVRETEAEARAAAEHIVAALEPEAGRAQVQRSLDAGSVGVAAQADLRSQSDADGYVDGLLFTGIGRGRSGCGAALVGTPGQVAGYLADLQEIGIEAVILSGYPHLDECRRAGELLLPLLDHAPLELEP